MAKYFPAQRRESCVTDWTQPAANLSSRTDASTSCIGATSRYLEFARAQGDALIVGLNSDSSVLRNKGPGRPINNEMDRAVVLSALRAVDGVVIFDEDEPRTLIEAILPHVLVKGHDWAHYVSGREIVEASGGRVVLAELCQGHSTTNTIERILRAGAA